MNRSLDRAAVLRDFALQWRRLERIEQVSFAARGSAFTATYRGEAMRGIVLVRSSDFWEYRLHLAGKQAMPQLVVCYRHETVLPVAVVELETGDQYQPHEFPRQFASYEQAYHSRSRPGRLTIVGGLLCGVQAAYDLLDALRQAGKESTCRKYENSAHAYQKRRRGRQVSLMA